MIVLVDYDNVRLGRRGLRHFASRLLDGVGVGWCSGESSIRCRLYGGWFDGARLSERAQRLVPESRACFRCAWRYRTASAPCACVCRWNLRALSSATGLL